MTFVNLYWPTSRFWRNGMGSALFAGYRPTLTAVPHVFALYFKAESWIVWSVIGNGLFALACSSCACYVPDKNWHTYSTCDMILNRKLWKISVIDFQVSSMVSSTYINYICNNKYITRYTSFESLLNLYTNYNRMHFLMQPKYISHLINIHEITHPKP